jgi:hypothetical protein
MQKNMFIKYEPHRWNDLVEKSWAREERSAVTFETYSYAGICLCCPYQPAKSKGSESCRLFVQPVALSRVELSMTVFCLLSRETLSDLLFTFSEQLLNVYHRNTNSIYE